jgi:predicted Rossmann-fold nucleotide-binding protein
VATLRQTQKIRHFPIVLVGSDYWHGLVDWLRDPVLREGKIVAEDVERLQVVDEPSEVLAILEDVEHRRPRKAA